jgi:hypothetical protein
MIRITTVVRNEQTGQLTHKERTWDDELYAPAPLANLVGRPLELALKQRAEAFKTLLGEGCGCGQDAADAYVRDIVGIDPYPMGGGEDIDAARGGEGGEAASGAPATGGGSATNEGLASL